MLEGTLRVGCLKVKELRKLNGKRRVIRLSVPLSDASRSTAVTELLAEQDNGLFVADHTRAPSLVPVLSLGRRMEATAGAQAGTVSLAAASTAAGGPQLHPASLATDMFEASQMQAVNENLMNMTVNELKEELEARGEPRTGPKASLRRTLHSAIVRAHI